MFSTPCGDRNNQPNACIFLYDDLPEEIVSAFYPSGFLFGQIKDYTCPRLWLVLQLMSHELCSPTSKAMGRVLYPGIEIEDYQSEFDKNC